MRPSTRVTPPSRRGRRVARLLRAVPAVAVALGGVAVAVAATVAAPASAAGPSYNLQGSWETGSLNGNTRGPQAGTYAITSMDMSTGAFSGTATVSGISFALQGTETGSSATLTLSEGGYVATDTLSLSILADGNLGGDGSFTDTNGNSGNFWAELTSAKPSATQVNCSQFDPGTPSAYFVCTATVADASGAASPGTPTGTVTFSVNPGGGGGFPQATCTLQPSQSGPTSYCSETYDPPAGGVPTGSQPAIAASYSGDSSFAPSSGQPQSSVATGTGTDTTTQTTTTAQTTTSSETTTCTQTSCPTGQCPDASAPVDGVPTPTPPGAATDTAASYLRDGLIQIPTGVDPYCRDKTTYTAAEKKAAGDWNAYYADQASLATAGAAVSGGIAASAAAIPDPTVSKAVAIGYGVYAGVAGLSAAYYGHLAALETVVQNDPPDPHWRTIVAALRTRDRSVALPAGLPAKARSALRSYDAALLAAQSDAWCVQTAINRGSTAVSHHDLAIARRQYVAGERCAIGAMHAEQAIPGRFSAARGAVLAWLPKLTASQRRALAARARRGSVRAAAVNRLIAELSRVIALPSGLAAELRHAAASVRAITPQELDPRGLFAAPVSIAASAALQRQEAEILAAAAKVDAKALAKAKTKTKGRGAGK